MPAGGKFPQVAAGGGLIVVVWQELTILNDTGGDVTGDVRLSMMAKTNGGGWTTLRNFAGPYPFVGREASIYSLTVDKTGNIFIAISTTDKEIHILRSSDMGKSFEKVSTITSAFTTISPRVFSKETGGYLLFVTQELQAEGTMDALSTYYSLSDNGANWTPFTLLVREQDRQLNFLPNHASVNGKEYVVFQVLETGERPSYQLYVKVSSDGGASWGPLVWLSGFAEDQAGLASAPNLYDNQRPALTAVNGRPAVAWERRYQAGAPQIYYMELNADGSIRGDPERVSQGVRSCRYPQIVALKGVTYLLWFDNRTGEEQVIIAWKDRLFWQDGYLNRMTGVSVFHGAIVVNDKLYVVWENQRAGVSRIVFLAPDRTAPSPLVVPLNFIAGRRAKQDGFTLSWNLPRDSSGIAAFSYSLDKDPDGRPPREVMVSAQAERTASFTVDEDGYWYVHLAAEDFAGNWSPPVTTSFYRDTTPPDKVTIAPPEKDDKDFLSSNSVTFNWDPPEGDDPIGGYSYMLQYLGEQEPGIDAAAKLLQTPPPRIGETGRTVFFRNRDDGYWAFAVRGIDSVGNAGEATVFYFKLNKYVPETYITNIEADRDELGRVYMRVTGRGFTVGGLIEKVILDRDGIEPWDYVYLLEAGSYAIFSDRAIEGPTIDEIDAGRYRVGLIHPTRGLYVNPLYLTMENSGAVKFGDFRGRTSAAWSLSRPKLFTFSTNNLILLLVLVFLTMSMVLSLRRIGQVSRESRFLEKQVHALLTQQDMPERIKKERIAEMKKMGMGLRIKFTLFITALLFSVVIMMSLTLAFFIIETQRQNLTDGLRKQTEVLLESLASGGRAYLPAKNTLELGQLPAQKSAMEDALFVTITGDAEGDAEKFDYIWATDDDGIGIKIDTPNLVIGTSRVTDDVSAAALDLKDKINAEATAELSEIVQQLDALGEEARKLALSEQAGAAERLAEYQKEIAVLQNRVNTTLLRIGNKVGSVPEFNAENLSPLTSEYVFYKPIVYSRRGETTYFRGMVRLGVSTDRILNEIENSRKNLIIRIGIITLIAIGLGVGGALLFSTIMIIPINKLLKGVEKIRDTEDKEELKEHLIRVRARDEIHSLADTVNQMTQGLVKAAIANKELQVGKDIQKMYIPLETDSSGKKLTTGKEVNSSVEFFGYYEGAKGVSGDYFDFVKVDPKHYVIVKCDVAGKGVSAALIMVQVATIFLNYYKKWNLETQGIHLDQLLYDINDLLEERGFKGRFAALIVAVLNIETGVAYLCHAGDNTVNLYDAGQGAMTQMILPEAPAAGVFPNMLVEMKGGFKQVPLKLKKGDCMLLFTDGIEEAKRTFRDANFKPIICQEPGFQDGELHGNHPRSSGDEEFGIPRIQQVVNAVFDRSVFTMTKYHNPIPDEELVFDFSTCEGTVEEAVLGMVSVERIFRIIKNPAAGAEDRIYLDHKVSDFLRKHFKGFSSYFAHPVETLSNSESAVYSHLKQDEQYDDLTILGVRKL